MVNSEEGYTVLPRGTVHLSALDRQAESFIEPAAWQRNVEHSLLNNILFDTAVLIPDVFFFISRGLMGHINTAMVNNRISLLEASISAGIAIPAFREKGCADFTQAYTTINSTGIRGLLPYEGNVQHIVARLDAAARDADAFRAVTWPERGVGALFEDNLTTFFQPPGDVSPIASPRIQEIWQRTGPWRLEVLNSARRRRTTGFRRGDYMAALGEAVGLGERPIDDVSQLFPAVRDPGERLALQVLCLWMNECYSYSQARAFGIRPNLPDFRPEYSLATLAALESAGDDRVGSQTEELTVTASMPPQHVLLTMDAEALVQLRRTPAGQDYFAAADYWRGNPLSEGAKQAVGDTFWNYAKAISWEAYKKETYNETFIKLRLAAFNGPTRKLATAVTAAMSAATGAVFGAAGLSSVPYIMAGGVTYAAYVWATDRARTRGHTLKASIELCLPAD
ncbi:hypothetical protein [Nonomuraea endophytica]|uniref:hypothetical protein n=1 Tax=Nonomuraea endophytica TaxID=714136 RepID=UPI0037C856F7